MGPKLLRTLAMLAALALALILPPFAEGQEASPGAVTLAYKFTPEDVTRYRITQKLTGTRTFTGATEAAPIDAELNSTMRVRCVRSVGDGSAEVAFGTESGDLRIGGRSVAGYSPPKEIRTLSISPVGRIVGPARSEPSGQVRRRPPMDFGSVESIVLMAILPDKPVAVGDSWSAEIPLPVESSSTLRLSFRLEAVRQTSGGRVAVIKQTISTPINRNASDDLAVPRGSQDGQAELLFSIDGGKLLSAQGTIRSMLTTPATIPAVPSGGAEPKPRETVSTLNLDSKFGVELIEQAPRVNRSSTD